MKRSAFTLVELLIVMAVIAALISVVAPMGLNALKQARTVQVATDFAAARNDVYGKVATYNTTAGITWTNKTFGKTEFSFAPSASSGYFTVTAVPKGNNWDELYLAGALKNDGDFHSYYTNGILTFKVTEYIIN
mgnify:CR=1 FL=1